MCHLLTDSSVEVQKMAYQFLHEAAKKRTEYLVIELGVDTEDAAEAQLPVELIDILQQSLSVGDGLEDNENVRSSKTLCRSLPLSFFIRIFSDI
jgi:E3 ubiquitin-protein ligase listerin